MNIIEELGDSNTIPRRKWVSSNPLLCCHKVAALSTDLDMRGCGKDLQKPCLQRSTIYGG